MGKRMNRTWLLLFLLAVIAAGVILWFCIGRTAGSYSGGILIERSDNLPEEDDFISGEWS